MFTPVIIISLAIGFGPYFEYQKDFQAEQGQLKLNCLPQYLDPPRLFYQHFDRPPWFLKNFLGFRHLDLPLYFH